MPRVRSWVYACRKGHTLGIFRTGIAPTEREEADGETAQVLNIHCQHCGDLCFVRPLVTHSIKGALTAIHNAISALKPRVAH